MTPRRVMPKITVFGDFSEVFRNFGKKTLKIFEKTLLGHYLQNISYRLTQKSPKSVKASRSYAVGPESVTDWLTDWHTPIHPLNATTNLQSEALLASLAKLASQVINSWKKYYLEIQNHAKHRRQYHKYYSNKIKKTTFKRFYCPAKFTQAT